MDNVKNFPTNPDKPNEVKKFLNKPMHETTIGDTLIIHTGTLVITFLVGLTVEGWIEILRRARRK